MAYVRQRGKQLAIVQGERDQDGKVQQRVLFAISSKAEALKILEERDANGGQFKYMLEHEFPGIKFNWTAIHAGIAAGLERLPDLHLYRETRLATSFRNSLITFARELMLADPQSLAASAQLIEDQKDELQYLSDLIDFRLRFKDTQETEFNRDNQFYWRSSLQGGDAPPNEEEKAEALYRRGEYDKAATIFRMLVECFDEYADGHNYLGLIALEQARFDEALVCFQRAMAIGRKKFQKRIAKKRYWRDHETRPYMRGMMNTIMTLGCSGKALESLTWCSRLEHECGDHVHADSLRVAPYIELARWKEALAAANSVRDIEPAKHLMAAIALFELGRPQDATAAFVRGAMHHPRAARRLFGMANGPPKSNEQKRDHNAGVELAQSLPTYLKGKSRGSRRFFADVLRLPSMQRLLQQLEDAVEARNAARGDDYKPAFNHVMKLQSEAFAREHAQHMFSSATVS